MAGTGIRNLAKTLLALAAAGFFAVAGGSALPARCEVLGDSSGTGTAEENSALPQEGEDSGKRTLSRDLGDLRILVAGDLPEACDLYVQDLSYVKSYADAVDRALGEETAFVPEKILNLSVRTGDTDWNPEDTGKTLTVSVEGLADPQGAEVFCIDAKEETAVLKVQSTAESGAVRFPAERLGVFAIGSSKTIDGSLAKAQGPAAKTPPKRAAKIIRAAKAPATALEGYPYAVLTDGACTADGVTYSENSLLFVRSKAVVSTSSLSPQSVTRLDGSTVHGYVRKVDETTVNRVTGWGWTNDLYKITQIATLDPIRPHSTEDWFNTLDLANGWKKECPATKIDLSRLDTSQVKNMTAMFEHCTKVTSLDLSGFDTGNAVNMDNLFNNCQSLSELNLSGWDTGSARKMNGMFNTCLKLKTLDLSGWDTGNVTTMEQMFWNCRGLTSLSMKGWDTSNVTDMNGMFRRCDLLSDFSDVSGFDTGKVTNLSAMFSKCYAMKTLDLSNFDTAACTNMQNMFLNDTALSYLNIGNFDMKSVTNTGDMFTGDGKLTTIVVPDRLPAAAAAAGVAIPNTLCEKFDSGDYGIISYQKLPASPGTRDETDDGTMTITVLPMYTVTFLSSSGGKVLYTETLRHGADASGLHTDYLWCTDPSGRERADLSKITGDLTVYGASPIVVPTGLALHGGRYLLPVSAVLSGMIFILWGIRARREREKGGRR